ncbi:MAG: amidohydrolase [Acidimicrobiales bacterium]
MNPSIPRAEAVAVRGDRILAVGTVDELASWGDHVVDRRFADRVLLPGFVEAHTHVMSGGMWDHPYIGWFDRTGPDGRHWPGARDVATVIDLLRHYEAELDDPDDPLIAWGLDPIYFAGERLVARHLDQVSDRRPIFVYHASGHLATVNTAMLRRENIDATTPTPGVARGPDGQPNGELQEPAAMMLASAAYPTMFRSMHGPDAIRAFAAEARNTGQTTVTDLGSTAIDRPRQLEAWKAVTAQPDFPVRVMVAAAPGLAQIAPSELGSMVRDLAAEMEAAGNTKLRFGIAKIILDGSIQGFTARISWPHYYRPPEGHPGNGLWLVPPDRMADLVTDLHRAGLIVHCHCNGDEASEVFIDAVATALERHPRADHRHTVQHCQLTTPAQYRRMAALGMQANIFSNHIFYWGDQHHDVTLGPDRAAAMDACATAHREGVRFAIHADTPVTPMGQLHTAWCAVNRLTASGRVLGPDERIPVETALEAITLGAAHQLGLDHEIGSIEAGKLADFAVLDDDPLTADPTTLAEIGVWGTVLGGVPQPGAGRSDTP